MNPSIQKIVSLPELLELRVQWKDDGHRVVFTNGCFDILHLGHVDCLEKARGHGDKLIVAVNGDASIKRLKGEQRPVNDEESRIRLIAALGFVDAVVCFEDDTPEALIKLVLPDVLVKGGDYERSNIVGAEFVMKNGGSVETITLVPGVSTTDLIKKIRYLNS